MITGFLSDDDHQVLLQQVFRTTSARERMLGLLGRKPLGATEGFLIEPCASVHTFFMPYSIDLVYLDRQFMIRKLVHVMKPWRMSYCPGAQMTLELPANRISQLGLQKDMQLIWSTNE